jgi:hypothetical protein
MAAPGLRGVYVCEGSSDLPIADHIERIAAGRGFELRVAAPDLSRLPVPVGRNVASQVTAALGLVQDPSLLFVHRDADREDPEVRRQQVREAVLRAGMDLVTVPVVPVRMTEAWLLADERAIRFVAGNPGGRQPLGLPPLSRLEEHADPKSLVGQVLRVASGLSGRRLRNFTDDFGHHRRQLLERLDPEGDVQKLPSWQRFVADVELALDNLGSA